MEISGSVQAYLGIALPLVPSLGATSLKPVATYVNYVYTTQITNDLGG